MSICIALWMFLSRSINALDIKRKETKQQRKRDQQRLSEQSHESPSIHSGREYQHLGGHEHPGEEALRDSDHGHDGRNNSFSQTIEWLDTEVVDPLEDKLPMYDHNAARLPPYDGNGSFPHTRRQREGSHGDVRNGAQINEARRRGGACTEMRIMHHPDVMNQGGAVIWYDALEDRYEVISRSLAPPTEPPLPPPYMPLST